MVIAVVILFAFYKLERWKERHDLSPLFEFGELRHRGFRYGLVTSSVLAMGQMGMFFVLPVFLQDAKHLSAETNGFWMLPFGVFMIIGSQLGGYLTRHLGTTRVVQIGLVFEMVGLVVLAFVVDPGMTLRRPPAPVRAVFGMGIGFASSQLTNVILSDISADKAGMASGTNSTVRQVGARARRGGRGLRLRQPHAAAHGRRRSRQWPPRGAARHRGGGRPRAGGGLPGSVRHSRRPRRRR